LGLTGDWQILCNDKLHTLISSPNIVTEVKAKNMRWAGNVAGMEKKELLGGKT